MFSKNYIAALILPCLVVALCFGCKFVGDDDSQSESETNPEGIITGLVQDSFTGNPVSGASIRAMTEFGGWITATTSDEGIFEFFGMESSSKIYMEFSAEDYCSMSFFTDTQTAEHSGQLTDVVLSAIKADSSLIVKVMDENVPLEDVAVGLTPTSYDYKAVSEKTDIDGEVEFDAGLFQKYQVRIMPEDQDGDGRSDFEGVIISVTILSDPQTLEVNLKTGTIDDDTVFDDDTSSDDDDTSSDDDNDTSSDDDTGSHPPVLSNSYWDPNPAEMQSGNLISALYFDICDLGDDLSGGALYVYQAGTTEAFLTEQPVDLDSIELPLSPADDCLNPLTLGLGINFTGASSGEYCCDIEAVDSEGSVSNLLENICVTVS